MKTTKKERRTPKAHISPRSFVDYYKYMASKAWKDKRRKWCRKARWKCEICGSMQKINVHHKHYKTLGSEKRGDVQILCRHCHEHKHELDGVELTDSLNSEYQKLAKSIMNSL